MPSTVGGGSCLRLEEREEAVVSGTEHVSCVSHAMTHELHGTDRV